MNQRLVILIVLTGIAGIVLNQVNWSKHLKVIKNVTFAQANVFLLFYLSMGMFERMTFNEVGLIINLTVVLPMLLLVIYLKGTTYRVSNYPEVNLSPLLLAAIDASGIHNFKQSQTEDGSLFTIDFEDFSGVLTLESKESLLLGQTIYLLNFKKWRSIKLRRSILSQFKTKLEDYTPIPQKTLPLMVERGLLITLILLVLIYGNSILIKPYRVDLSYDGPLPERLDITISQSDTKQYGVIKVDKRSDIAMFYEALHNETTQVVEDVAKVDIEASRYSIQLDKSWQTLYLRPSNGYVIIDYEALKQASMWHHLSVSIYQLFGGDDHAIYGLYATSNINFIVDSFVEN